MNERSRSFAAISIATNKDIKAAVESSDLNALLRSKLRKLTVDNQTYYLAEGDTLLDEDQLGVYALTKQKEAEAHKAIATASAAGFGTERLGLQARGLIAMTQGGKIVRWEPNTVLSYRVVRNTFGGKKQNYDLVVTCMHDATKAWEDTCGWTNATASNPRGRGLPFGNSTPVASSSPPPFFRTIRWTGAA